MSQPIQHPPSERDIPHGSVDQWDEIWKKYSADEPSMRKLFTREKPATIYQFWQRCYFEDFLQIVQPRSDWKFLELASGRGTTSMYLASQGFADITLLDLSVTALQQAEMNFAAEHLPKPHTYQADAEKTGFPSSQFDCIYNIGVLEHFHDPSKILAESFRLLKPGGKIFMPIVPAMPFTHSLICRTLFNPISIPKRIAKNWLRRSPKHEGMVRTETGRAEYRRVAESVGFRDVECCSYNPYWKVNRDGSFVERWFALPAYRLHHAVKRGLKSRPSLKTFSGTASCLLLVGTKKQAAG